MDTVKLELTWAQYSLLMDIVKFTMDKNPKSTSIHLLHKEMYMKAKVIKNKS